VLYSSAFRRLAGITQVVSPGDGAAIHNRLSHCLKVGQVARAVASRLGVAKEGIDPLVAEAAAFAHDLGHPPFGHVSERVLDELARRVGLTDGFEGNAQSFRIVTVLAARDSRWPGLNLCRATLDALLKYPWRWEDGERKWGAYQSEAADFRFARDGHSGRERCDEAEIMDWADDVTYAVHDVEDFFRAGLIPLDRLVGHGSGTEREAFVDGVLNARASIPAWEGHRIGSDRLMEGLERVLVEMAPAIDQPFAGSRSERARLRSFTSALIGRYIHSGLAIDERGNLCRDPQQADEVVIMKEMTWRYVITDARLASQQEGHRRIIRTLFDFFGEQVRGDDPGIPPGYRDALASADDEHSRLRVAVDIVAGMSEAHALRLHRRLSGVDFGALVERLG